MLKIAVMVSGGGTNLQAIIDAHKQGKLSGVTIDCVVSNKPDAYALKRAEENGITGVCIRPKDYEDKDAYGRFLAQYLSERGIGLVVLAGFLVVLPANFIEAFEGRIINIHPSLIPSFCGDGFYGLKVHEAALARGVKVTGATVHYVDAGTDTGPIILQKAVYVEDGDTPEVLQKRVMEQAEWIILPQAIKMIADSKR
ncbi:MAG: phosphoribosylglycinamide formyltransferase [Lachnospiraceae bacterium]|nr:phosphoribosylglycinamide formyltransferase [Lachnospiraceae bacterium]